MQFSRNPKISTLPFIISTLILASLFFFTESNPNAGDPEPIPTPWPLQFHSILFINITSKGTLQMIDLWYDWPNGRNFNIIQNQLGNLVYDLEWNNGTSFIYTLDSSRECQVLDVPVGILRPDWLDGANYLGQKYMDGFLCNVWEKVEFIWYYVDVVSKRPVYWAFYTGMVAHVMTFEVGKVLSDPNWQAPVYCFNNSTVEYLGSPIVSDAMPLPTAFHVSVAL
nr:uncharacterized protein At4g14100-like [Ipomoea trifida]